MEREIVEKLYQNDVTRDKKILRAKLFSETKKNPKGVG